MNAHDHSDSPASPESAPTPPADDEPSESPAVTAGQALPYHRAIRDFLRETDRSVWDWFANQSDESSANATRLELLKNAYRLDRDQESELYRDAEDLRDQMGLSAPVTFYQSQHQTEASAANVWVKDELHIIFSGALRDVLSEDELKAVICHEFAHFELFEIEGHDYQIVDAILQGMSVDAAADSAHQRTSRSFRLWTELYCDRRAAQILKNIQHPICALVKVETGSKKVSASSYLKQAQEIISKGKLSSKGVTHPETFIRAYALDCWEKQPDEADEQLQPLVEGSLALETLDLLQQNQLTQFTQDFVKSYLSEPWLQSRLMVNHAQQFFNPHSNPNPQPIFPAESKGNQDLGKMKQQIESFDNDLRRYLCYVLLDFVTCDADLEEGPLAAAFLFCEKLGLSPEFRRLVHKEIKAGKKVIDATESEAEKIVRQMQKEVAK